MKAILEAGWDDRRGSNTGNPNTPPNTSVHFQDSEATRRPVDRACEVLDDSGMSEATDLDDEDAIADIIRALTHRIRQFERAAKCPPTPPTINQNNPLFWRSWPPSPPW